MVAVNKAHHDLGVGDPEVATEELLDHVRCKVVW